MAAPGPANIIARCVSDDLMDISGETAPSKYMKFFLNQKLAESRRFTNRMHEDAETIKECLSQITVVIAKLQAMLNQDEFHDGLLAAKDAMHSDQSKLVALNHVITEALEGIETTETAMEILDG
nr:hypothetical protein [Tanacetum cinerariifolium]